jgi:hypothetical protein
VVGRIRFLYSFRMNSLLFSVQFARRRISYSVHFYLNDILDILNKQSESGFLGLYTPYRFVPYCADGLNVYNVFQIFGFYVLFLRVLLRQESSRCFSRSASYIFCPWHFSTIPSRKYDTRLRRCDVSSAGSIGELPCN